MGSYTLRKLGQLVPTVIGVVTLVFLMLRALPGDPAAFIAGDNVGEDALVAVRQQLGLNEPLLSQYGNFWKGLFSLDIGRSVRTGIPVRNLLGGALPTTVTIAVSSLVVGLLVAVPLGTMAAHLANKGRRGLDRIVTGSAMVVDAVPSFWLGLLLMLAFSLSLGWLPATGPVPFGSPGSLARRLALPVMVLTVAQLATVARITRTSVLEALSEDHVRTARAMGKSGLRVLYGNALRNALLPVITVAGLGFGRLLGGTVIVETVFALPGMGSMLVNGINSRDYPVVQGIVLVYALLFIMVNLSTDLLYRRIDPRVSL